METLEKLLNFQEVHWIASFLYQDTIDIYDKDAGSGHGSHVARVSKESDGYHVTFIGEYKQLRFRDWYVCKLAADVYKLITERIKLMHEHKAVKNMDELKERLDSMHIKWEVAFDSEKYISIYDDKKDIICRVYRDNNDNYVGRYYGKYVVNGCADFIEPHINNLVDEITNRGGFRSNKRNKLDLEEVRRQIDSELESIGAITTINLEDKYIRVGYDGLTVCKITPAGVSKSYVNVYYHIPFDHRSMGYSSDLLLLPTEIVNSVKNRINIYNENRKEVNNMKKHFIVEKMDVHQTYLGPDTINMTISAYPDGISRQMGDELKTVIESLDPCKLDPMKDVTIKVNVPSASVVDTVYAYSARSNGKMWRACNEYVDKRFSIKDVIFNDPATIVFWADGEKTVVKCQNGEKFDPEKGLAMAIAKKLYGGKHEYYEVFAKHVGRYNKKQKKEEKKEKMPKFVEDKIYHDLNKEDKNNG